MDDEDDPPPTDPAKAWETAYPNWDPKASEIQLPSRPQPTRIWRTLTPGIFSSGDRGRVLRQAGAPELLAHRTVEEITSRPKVRFGPSITAMTLVDHFTHAREPVPEYVVNLVTRLSGKQAVTHHETVEAWRLTADGLDVAQIARRLGVSVKTAERRLEDHPADVQPDVALLIADARNYGRVEHWPRRADRRRVVAVMRDHVDRPLTLEAYQAIAIALGLADKDGRLTDATVEALNGVRDPAAFHASARAEGEERAKKPRGTVAMEQRHGPERVRPLNTVNAVNQLHTIAGADRTTIERWADGSAVPSADLTVDRDWTFEEWSANAPARTEATMRFVADFKAASPWQREAWGHETVARWSGRDKRRQND